MDTTMKNSIITLDNNLKTSLNYTYIYHSCFTVESDKYVLIFDYYKTPKGKEDYLDKVFSSAKSLNKKILVFSSHGHYDHFNPKILEWDKKYSNISYILSDDIYEANSIIKKDNYFIARENEKILFDSNIEIYSFGSTDLGVSFLIKINNTLVFHAGDLNWWNWGEEDTKEEALEMETNFKSIVSKIEDTSKKLGDIEIAFFPIDPRLGIHSKDGSKYFIDTLNPKLLVPMHFES